MKNLFKIVVTVGLISLFAGSVFAVNSSIDRMMDEMSIGLIDNPEDRSIQNLINNFCVKVGDSKGIYDDKYFDANQSVFLSVLCKNVGYTQQYNIYNNFMLKTGFNQFGISEYNADTRLDNCNYSTTNMNACDLSKHLPKIFDQIANDYFNIKQADLYGVDSVSQGVKNEDLANNFSKHYFVGLEMCDPDDDYYDQTCRDLKNYMQGAKKLLKKTKVINFEELSNLQDIDCINDFDQNILYCGLIGDELKPDQSFLNVIYNEYMWYRLFVAYYSFNIKDSIYFADPFYTSSTERIDSNNERFLSFEQKIISTRGAISIAIRSLSEISSSFPLHIGFLMYQEDANMFMKELAKIYAPIRTLYDKLRNVQIAE
ncbi:MAG TPA: hypothetical protein P5060_03570 [Candidatus Absconditabacterales bacterium]|nr:hypothetical protein [Candidatus Absconditabacterales bacterium]